MFLPEFILPLPQLFLSLPQFPEFLAHFPFDLRALFYHEMRVAGAIGIGLIIPPAPPLF